MRRSLAKHLTTMNVNLNEQHLSYIKDMKLYSKSFKCSKCNSRWRTDYLMRRHERTCQQNVKQVYKGGVYVVPETIFERLEAVGVNISKDRRFYPYFVTYDAEAYFDKGSELPKSDSEHLQWRTKHVPLSISVCSNFPGYLEPRCFVNTKCVNSMIDNCILYIQEIAVACHNYLRFEFEDVFSELEQLAYAEKHNKHNTVEVDNADDDATAAAAAADDDDDDDDADYDEEDADCDTLLSGVKKRKRKRKQSKSLYHKLYEAFDDYLKQIPVVGFNSGKYDVNMLKVYLFQKLKDKETIKYVIKRNSTFPCIATPTMKWLDITNYLAPGFSYDRYLKAYGCKTSKGIFPYEWMDSLDKLNCRQLPPYNAFYSSLKGCNVSVEDYDYACNVWSQLKMQTFQDYLKWYNNMDVAPFVEAVEKQRLFYAEHNLDLFKDGISVPGLTLKFLFSKLPEGVYFSLYGTELAAVHDKIKTNLVGGPSIIFHRYHEAGITKIRELQFKEESKLCKQVVGYDANALYLYALMQPMPTGRLIRRQSTLKFIPEPTRKYGYMANEWLMWLMNCNSCLQIQHQFNGREKKVGSKQIPVDGFDLQTNTVYQFHGCYWHGHDCLKTKKLSVQLKKERFARTQRISKYIKACGYNLVEKWECEWQDEIKASFKVFGSLWDFIDSRRVECVGGKNSMTEKEILALVLSGDLFGMVECDIHVPKSLEDYFSEMQPIFKNTTMYLKDVGPFMQQYAEEIKLNLKGGRRSLVGSFFGEKILLTTSVLQWYLQKGLVVTKIYDVLQYTPYSCFEQFGQMVTKCRRQEDLNPGDHTILADTMKLFGNSAYGKTITNKNKFTDIAYCDENEALYKINRATFKCLHQLDDNLFEVEAFKQKVIQDMPLQIGFFVYQEAKLHMLKFYYDFIDQFIDRRDFQYCAMDTDSAYMALSSTSLGSLVPEEKKEAFYKAWNLWFPAEVCDSHWNSWFDIKIGRAMQSEELKFEQCEECHHRRLSDKRTPGLFKLEWKSTGIIAPCSKTYYCFGENSDKLSCKGVSKNKTI